MGFIHSFFHKTDIELLLCDFLELIVTVNKAKQNKTNGGITYPLWRKGKWEKTRGRIRLLVDLLCVCI